MLFLQKELENKQSNINNLWNMLGSYTNSESAKQLHYSPLDNGSNLFYKENRIIRPKRSPWNNLRDSETSDILRTIKQFQ